MKKWRNCYKITKEQTMVKITEGGLTYEKRRKLYKD